MLIGSSPVMQTLRHRIERVARSNVKVLISGPTGVGKELVARKIHSLSLRGDRPFISINCAALTESLLETELFGHSRGSFTGATHNQKGKLELATTGTLFLDEIGDLSLSAQARILRFVESGEIQPIGLPTRTVNVRIVTATNRDLGQMVAGKEFRPDLYYRVRSTEIAVPTLKERLSDVHELVDHFAQVMTTGANGHDPKSISSEILKKLPGYSWPGNVRELRNLAENLLMGNDWELPELVRSLKPSTRLARWGK